MRDLVRSNLFLSGLNAALGLVIGVLIAWIAAELRGTVQPNGSTPLGDAPAAYWVGVTFRIWAPYGAAIGSIVGVVVGQVQFFASINRQDQGN